MKKFLPLLLLLLASCTTGFRAVSYHFQEEKITRDSAADEDMLADIQPFKDSLSKEMNTVLGFADDALTKTQPESDLGNFMCDLILKKSSDYYQGSVDFTLLNHGGIRLPTLPKGEVTLGEITELMPFENRIAIMQLSGYTVDTLFNHMALNGGWHISGAQYKIKDKKATEITIHGNPLDYHKTYTVAISDYLAKGGDNCAMLKGLPYTDTQKTIREALIEGVKEMTAKGEHIKSKLDGRIQLAP